MTQNTHTLVDPFEQWLQLNTEKTWLSEDGEREFYLIKGKQFGRTKEELKELYDKDLLKEDGK